MRTRSQARKRRQPQVRQTSVESSNLEKPDNPPIVTMADNRTMAQLLEAPTEGYEDAIVIPEITANNFEIKHGLLNLVQNKQFFGNDKEDPHAHIRYFNKITSTMKIPNNESQDSAKIDETFCEALGSFNDLLRGPNMGFQNCIKSFDTFYNALNSIDQDSVNLLRVVKTCIQMANLTDMLSKFVTANTASTSGSGTLPGITTRSGVTIQGPKAVNLDTEVTKDTMPPANNGSTEDVQPPVVQIQSRNPNPEPNVSPVDTPIPKASIPFPSRRNDESADKSNDKLRKFL
ncbi:hypothetical protein Tco_0007805 [Tanacetum coccineum]